MLPEHIFFYGALMRGFDLRRRSGIDAWIRFVGKGSIRGALFDLGPYPAVIQAEGVVHGELYAVTDHAALLATADGIEGYQPDNLPGSQYVRQAAPVRMGSGVQRTAWVYFYNARLGDAVWVPSGDYRRHVTRRVLSGRT